MFTSYWAVLRVPGVLRPVVGVAVASVPIGALSLSMLLLVRAATGRYAVAGLVVGALALGTGCGIVAQGRLMDRVGLTRVLSSVVGIQLACLAGFVVAVRAQAPAWLPALLAFGAGAGEPQVGGALRALWADLVPGPLLPAAIASSSVILEAAVLAGPVFLIAAVAVVGSAGAVLCCGACFAVGALLLASSGAARSRVVSRPARASLWGPLTSPGVRLLTVVAAVVGAAGALTQFSAATLAPVPGQAPWLYAALSAGSLTGALGYGARRRPGTPAQHLGLLFGGLSVAMVGCAVSTGLARAAIGLFLCGLLLGPLMVACFSAVAGHIPAGAEVGGFTTLTAASLGAGAAVTAVAGVLTEAAGPVATLTLGAVIALAGVPLALVGARRLTA